MVSEKLLGKAEEVDFFKSLSEREKTLLEVGAKIEILLHEAEENPDWKAVNALRCLYKELTGTQLPRD